MSTREVFLKVLALDLGDKWVGSAISDSMMIHSFPFKTMERKNLLQDLKEIVRVEQISTIVYGMPFTLKGAEGLQSRKVSSFVDALRLDSVLNDLKWVYIDERFSSQGALHVLHLQSKNIKDNKRQEHSIVAALLLQAYLQALQI